MLLVHSDFSFHSQFLGDDFQRALAHWNRERLAPALPGGDWRATLARDHQMMRMEGAFLEELRAEVAAEIRLLLPQAPEPLLVSGKTGAGVPELLAAIVAQLPPPRSRFETMS